MLSLLLLTGCGRIENITNPPVGVPGGEPTGDAIPLTHFQINHYLRGDQKNADATILDGNLLTVYVNEDNNCMMYYCIQDFSGNYIKGDTMLNTSRNVFNGRPSILVNEASIFIIWSAGDGIYMRRFDHTLNAVEVEECVIPYVNEAKDATIVKINESYAAIVYGTNGNDGGGANSQGQFCKIICLAN
jgi:hypothetical protein